MSSEDPVQQGCRKLRKLPCGPRAAPGNADDGGQTWNGLHRAPSWRTRLRTCSGVRAVSQAKWGAGGKGEGRVCPDRGKGVRRGRCIGRNGDSDGRGCQAHEGRTVLGPAGETASQDVRQRWPAEQCTWCGGVLNVWVLFLETSPPPMRCTCQEDVRISEDGPCALGRSLGLSRRGSGLGPARRRE